MILSPVENFFVRLLRGTVIATAAFALLVTALALAFAAYATLAPEPTADLPHKMARLRSATDPTKLISSLFPKDSEVYKTYNSPGEVIEYKFTEPTTDDLFVELNNFLDTALGAKIQSKETFSSWLFGDEAIQIRWSNEIDDKQASDENNVNRLWRSLLLDYTKRLLSKASSLKDANQKKLYPGSFDKLTAPTGRANAPYFVVWFFDSLSSELSSIQQELDKERSERAALRLTIPVALYVAGASFSYFIFIMFLFLVVSIEASVRHLAESTARKAGPRLEPSPPKLPDIASIGMDA